ncbi:MAG: hypothetical protein IH851_04770 [Armatimonadetes bacterium]|nr:hypothetical protein [Armatimonadota bacterium]
MTRPVPWPIVVYASLALADFGMTLVAFRLGAIEANPALAWFAREGLFEFVKLSLTLLVCSVAFLLWSRSLTKAVMLAANVMMLGVLAHHVRLWFSVL